MFLVDSFRRLLPGRDCVFERTSLERQANCAFEALAELLSVRGTVHGAERTQLEPCYCEVSHPSFGLGTKINRVRKKIRKKKKTHERNDVGALLVLPQTEGETNICGGVMGV